MSSNSNELNQVLERISFNMQDSQRKCKLFPTVLLPCLLAYHFTTYMNISANKQIEISHKVILNSYVYEVAVLSNSGATA